MLATPDLIALIEQNPAGMTTAQVASAFGVEPNKAAHRLSRASSYGMIRKQTESVGKRTNAALWLPKAKVAT
jgi:predicted RNA polymerase sigma factor